MAFIKYNKNYLNLDNVARILIDTPGNSLQLFSASGMLFVSYKLDSPIAKALLPYLDTKLEANLTPPSPSGAEVVSD